MKTGFRVFVCVWFSFAGWAADLVETPPLFLSKTEAKQTIDWIDEQSAKALVELPLLFSKGAGFIRVNRSSFLDAHGKFISALKASPDALKTYHDLNDRAAEHKLEAALNNQEIGEVDDVVFAYPFTPAALRGFLFLITYHLDLGQRAEAGGYVRAMLLQFPKERFNGRQQARFDDLLKPLKGDPAWVFLYSHPQFSQRDQFRRLARLGVLDLKPFLAKQLKGMVKADAKPEWTEDQFLMFALEYSENLIHDFTRKGSQELALSILKAYPVDKHFSRFIRSKISQSQGEFQRELFDLAEKHALSEIKDLLEDAFLKPGDTRTSAQALRSLQPFILKDPELRNRILTVFESMRDGYKKEHSKISSVDQFLYREVAAALAIGMPADGRFVKEVRWFFQNAESDHVRRLMAAIPPEGVAYVLEELKTAAVSPSSSISERAITTLATGNAEAGAFLVELILRSHDKKSQAIIRKIGHIASSNRRQVSKDVLLTLRVCLLDPTWSAERKALLSGSLIRYHKDIPEMETTLRPMLMSKVTTDRIIALEYYQSLWDQSNGQAVLNAPFLSLFLADPSPEVRSAALGGWVPLEGLLEFARKEKTSDGKIRAMGILLKYHPNEKGIIPVLCSLAQSTNPQRVREQALFSLQLKFGLDPIAVEKTVLEVLAEKKSSLTAIALQTVGDRQIENGKPHLINVLQQEPGNPYALWALFRLSPKEFWPRVEALEEKSRARVFQYVVRQPSEPEGCLRYVILNEAKASNEILREWLIAYCDAVEDDLGKYSIGGSFLERLSKETGNLVIQNRIEYLLKTKIKLKSDDDDDHHEHE